MGTIAPFRGGAKWDTYLMIIFGTQPKTSTVRRGEFYCPSCETRCKYSWVRVTQRFSLFFVPVLPLGDLAEGIGRAVSL